MHDERVVALFTKWYPLKDTMFLYARYGLNEGTDDELGLDDSHRLFEGLTSTNIMVRSHIKKREPWAGVLYHFGPSDKYDTLLDTPDEERSAAATVMDDACRKLGFFFLGYILQAENVSYFPGIVRLSYLGFHTDLHRYVFAEDLAFFHPLFSVS